MGTIDAAVGARLRRWRQALDKSVEEVALALAVTPGALRQIEDGHARASADQLLTLCDVLRMTPADIYRGVGDEVDAAQPSPDHPAPRDP